MLDESMRTQREAHTGPYCRAPLYWPEKHLLLNVGLENIGKISGGGEFYLQVLVFGNNIFVAPFRSHFLEFLGISCKFKSSLMHSSIHSLAEAKINVAGMKLKCVSTKHVKIMVIDN